MLFKLISAFVCAFVAALLVNFAAGFGLPSELVTYASPVGFVVGLFFVK